MQSFLNYEYYKQKHPVLSKNIHFATTHTCMKTVATINLEIYFAAVTLHLRFFADMCSGNTLQAKNRLIIGFSRSPG